MERAPSTESRLDDFALQVDRRFDFVDKRFDLVDQRFDLVDQRFDGMNQRFDRMDQRLEQMDQDLRDLRNVLVRVGGGMMVGLVGVIAAILARGV